MTESLVRKYYQEKRCNCASTILYMCRDLWNVDLSAERIDTIGDMCTYYRQDDICSAYSACITVIYMLHKNMDTEDAGTTNDITTALMELFDEQFSSRRCSSIRINHAQGDTRCLHVLIRIAEMMQELLCHIQDNQMREDFKI